MQKHSLLVVTFSAQVAHAPATQEGELAKSAMESRKKLAETARNNLVIEIVGAAKVYRGGGSEVFGLALDVKLKSAAEDSLVRLFPQFSKADAPSAAWENCIKRARAAHEQPFQRCQHRRACNRQTSADPTHARLRSAPTQRTA